MKKKIAFNIVFVIISLFTNAQTLQSPPPEADFTASPTIICAGESVYYIDETVHPGLWNWSFPGGTPSTSTLQNPVVTYSTPGTYGAILVAINSHGSDTRIKPSFITVNALPDTPVISQNGLMLTSSPAAQYLWSTGETTQNITITANGTYSVIITASTGCISTSNAVTILNAGVDELSNSNNVSIYPNPSTSQIIIHTDNYFKDALFTIYNSFGQEVRQLNSVSGQTIILSRENLQEGIYFLTIKEDNMLQVTKKIVFTN